MLRPPSNLVPASKEKSCMEEVCIQGITVPTLGIGTWHAQGRSCQRIVKEALEQGIRHIDTAQLYQNEREVGKAMRKAGPDRSQIFLTTKIGNKEHAAAAVKSSTEQSLKKLRTDYVDLLLIHWPVAFDEIAETLDAMQSLQAQGKTRAIGVSNFTPKQLQAARKLAPIFCNQVEYHPYFLQTALTRMAKEDGFLLTAYAPLARGKVCEDPVIRAIGAAHGKTPAQVTLRWLLDQPNLSAIPKTTNPTRLAENLDVFDFTLTPEEHSAIKARDQRLRLVDPPFAPAWDD